MSHFLAPIQLILSDPASTTSPLDNCNFPHINSQSSSYLYHFRKFFAFLWKFLSIASGGIPNRLNIFTLKWRKYACLPKAVPTTTRSVAYTGVMTTSEHIRYDHGPAPTTRREIGNCRGWFGWISTCQIEMHPHLMHSPSLKLPFNPSPSATAGRTKNMVLDPVIPKTVHNNAISRHHAAVFRGGIGLGPKNRASKDDGGWFGFGLLLLPLIGRHDGGRARRPWPRSDVAGEERSGRARAFQAIVVVDGGGRGRPACVALTVHGACTVHKNCKLQRRYVHRR